MDGRDICDDGRSSLGVPGRHWNTGASGPCISESVRGSPQKHGRIRRRAILLRPCTCPVPSCFIDTYHSLELFNCSWCTTGCKPYLPRACVTAGCASKLQMLRLLDSTVEWMKSICRCKMHYSYLHAQRARLRLSWHSHNVVQQDDNDLLAL